jgi:hypothetical protein
LIFQYTELTDFATANSNAVSTSKIGSKEWGEGGE